MMSKTKSMALVSGVMLVAASAIGCGNSVDDAKEAAKAPELQKSWQAERCDSIGSLRLIGASTRQGYEFSGETLKKVDQIYSEADCVEPAVSVTYTGVFTTHDEIAPDVSPFEVTFQSVQVVPMNEKGKDLLNTVNFCGKKDWAIHVPADLTAAARGNLCPLDALPKSRFDIYSVQDGVLYFGKGDDDDLTAAESRPVELDTEDPFRSR